MLDLFLEKFLFYIYLVIPFVFAVFLGILTFLKNPIYIRRISKTFFFIQFILAFLLLIKENNNSFSFFNFNFIFDEIASIFKKAGMNVANMDAFGNFQTYEYDTESYIDNIFTTPNIDINYVEAEVSKAGGSDHYPLSAYLKINKKMGSTKQTDTNKVSSDGFIDGWYKP